MSTQKNKHGNILIAFCRDKKNVHVCEMLQKIILFTKVIYVLKMIILLKNAAQQVKVMNLFHFYFKNKIVVFQQ
jgi:hypothetical protein